MRPLLLLSSFMVGLVLSAQPGDPSLFIPMQRPEPSIEHEPRRNGPSSPVVYGLTDTIVVRVTGHVKLDGNCGGSTPLYGFQRKEDDAWTDHLPPGRIQMCCGMPSAEWFQHTVALIPAHVARPAYGRPWVPGEYRVVIALVGDQELVGPPFTVVAGE
jgi:hypothetical protein